jgi:hypothetical protein
MFLIPVFYNAYLETLKSYFYLGLTIKYTGNLNISNSLLIEKGRKTYFKIKKTVGLNNPCNFLEKGLLIPLSIQFCCMAVKCGEWVASETQNPSIPTS